jgi:hypothetical protein
MNEIAASRRAPQTPIVTAIPLVRDVTTSIVSTGTKRTQKMNVSNTAAYKTRNLKANVPLRHKETGTVSIADISSRRCFRTPIGFRIGLRRSAQFTSRIVDRLSSLSAMAYSCPATIKLVRVKVV